MNGLLLDTNVLLYARGRDHPQREPSRRLLSAAARATVSAAASVEALQEYTHVLLRRSDVTRADALASARRVRALLRWHPVDIDVWDVASEILATHEQLYPRDAIHAATAVLQQLTLVSADTVFDRVEGLAWATIPAAAAALE